MTQDSLSTRDCATLIDGLDALLRERSVAYRLVSNMTAQPFGEPANVDHFGLPDILRLKRLLEQQVRQSPEWSTD